MTTYAALVQSVKDLIEWCESDPPQMDLIAKELKQWIDALQRILEDAREIIAESGAVRAVEADWMQAAAEEINEVDAHCHCSTMSEELAHAIIARHCPFKRDEAYMPVPRCETCAHWRVPQGSGTRLLTLGKCTAGITSNGIDVWTKRDFGCVKWTTKQCDFVFPVLIDNEEKRCSLGAGHISPHRWHLASWDRKPANGN